MRWLRRRRDFEREMADELASHVDHRADDLVASGLSRQEAVRRARIELGAVESHKEAARDSRAFGRTRRFLEQTARDLRFAARRLRKAPVFTLFSVVSIGVGAGVTTAMFSILYALIWAPSGVKDADRVALLGSQLQGVPTFERALSLADYEDYRRAQHSFTALAAVAPTYQPVAISSSTELVQGEAVTHEYFALLGVEALHGRVLQPADDRPSAPSVVVLSYRFWHMKFSGDATVVGRSIRIGGIPFEVVGVGPREYGGLSRAPTRAGHFWIPMSSLAKTGAFLSPLERPDDHARLVLNVVGRLSAAASVAEANAEASGLGTGLDQSFPLTTAVMTANGQRRVPGTRRWLVRSVENLNVGPETVINRIGIALFALVGLVLAVACTNLANLSLARGTGRQQELAVRLALGASRGRLIRELAAESTLIGIVGFGLAMVVSLPIMSLAATDGPFFNGTAAPIDPHVTSAAVLVAAMAVLLALLVFGLWPAVRLSRTDVRAVIAAGGVSGTPPWRAQRALIRWQVVVSVAFFCTAAVFISALSGLTRHDPGIDLDHLTVARTEFRVQQWDEARARRAIDAITSTPPSTFGFRAVAATSTVPFGSNVYVHALLATENELLARRQSHLLLSSTPGIFDALGIPIVQGRPFDQRDVAGSLPVVVLSETSAKQLFGTANAIGHAVVMQGSINAIDQKTVETRTVIGITRDTDTGSLLGGGRRSGMAFVPIAQRYEQAFFIVARSVGDAGTGSLRALIHSADQNVAIESAGSGLVMLGGFWIAVRVVAGVSLAIGVVTLMLTMAGLTGVLAHVVLRRTREIGIRKALGADANAIVWLVIRDGAKPVVSGTAIGLGLGILGGFLVRAALPISAVPVQPLAILIVTIAVVPATLLACYVPARRAARVDPNLTLKEL